MHEDKSYQRPHLSPNVINLNAELFWHDLLKILVAHSLFLGHLAYAKGRFTIYFSADFVLPPPSPQQPLDLYQ